MHFISLSEVLSDFTTIITRDHSPRVLSQVKRSVARKLSSGLELKFGSRAEPLVNG